MAEAWVVGLWLPAKLRAEVRAKRFTYSLHMYFVRKRVAIDDEVSLETDNVLCEGLVASL